MVDRYGNEIKKNSADYFNVFKPNVSGDTQCSLFYESATKRKVYQQVKGDLWSSWDLEKISTGIWRINQPTVYRGIAAVDNTDTGITYVGTTQDISNSASMGASYTRLNGAGEYIEFTVSGRSSVTISLAKVSNGGYANVTIDGGTDLVNLVELTGGNRRIDCYSPDNNNVNFRLPLSNILDVTKTYTIRITLTGTADPSSSDTYINFEGYGTNMKNAEEGLAVLYGLRKIADIGYVGSEYEYAYSVRPNGATVFNWTGSGHLNETMASKIYNHDGLEVDVTSTSTFYHSRSFSIVETGTAGHSEVSNIANVFVNKTFANGVLEVFHKHRWLVDCEIDSGLVAMLPVRPDFNRGYVVGDTNPNVPYVIENNDDSKLGRIQSNTAYVYNPNNYLFAALHMPNLSTFNDLVNSNDKFYIEDRSGGSLNKLYVQAFNPNSVITANSILEARQVYLVGQDEKIASITI